jgi:hypothetical protein
MIAVEATLPGTCPTAQNKFVMNVYPYVISICRYIRNSAACTIIKTSIRADLAVAGNIGGIVLFVVFEEAINHCLSPVHWKDKQRVYSPFYRVLLIVRSRINVRKSTTRRVVVLAGVKWVGELVINNRFWFKYCSAWIHFCCPNCSDIRTAIAIISGCRPEGEMW